MGMVVYFPAVAPPDAYAGLLADKRGSSVVAVAVAVAVVARKKCLRVVVGGCASGSFFSVLDADNWINAPDVLRLFADTDNNDVGGAEKAWTPANSAVRRRDKVSSSRFVMVTVVLADLNF